MQSTNQASNSVSTPSSNQVSTQAHERSYAKAVRYGRCGSDPRIVPEFIRLQTLAGAQQTREQQWQIQKGIVELLFQTIADPLLAACWRNWCVQCCCMPLHTMHCLSQTKAESESTKDLEREMSALKKYYLPTVM